MIGGGKRPKEKILVNSKRLLYNPSIKAGRFFGNTRGNR